MSASAERVTRRRALSLLAACASLLLAPVQSQYPCAWNGTKTANSICPDMGQPCSNKQLCARGLFCRATAVGQAGAGGASAYTGYCDTAPSISQVYGAPCTVGNDVPDCVYRNPLALSPQAAPSALRCIKAVATDVLGTCRIGPNKHGDACNLHAECASGICTTSLGTCQGIVEGQQCFPGLPDPCQPGHYCLSTGGEVGGVCTKSISAGNACPSFGSCTRGTYCAGQDATQTRCVAPLSAPDGATTFVGPWMCASGLALMTTAGASALESTYTCLPAGGNASLLTGKPCNSRLPPPPGYVCGCTAGGSFKLRPAGGPLAGVASAAMAPIWAGLSACLARSTGITNGPCQYDSLDMTSVRYGSCAYYACYPWYQQLAAAAGAAPFAQPLAQWADLAGCEVDAAGVFFAAAGATPCITLPRLEEWKCALPITPPTVASTSGLVAVIIIGVFLGFLGHAYIYRRENGTKIPCLQD